MKVQPNSVYAIDDDHLVFCGDICDPRFVPDILSPSLPSHFDHIFIDPHWGVVTLRLSYDDLDLPPPPYQDYLSALFTFCADHAVSGTSVVITAPTRAPGLIFTELARLDFNESWRATVPYGSCDTSCYLAGGAFKNGNCVIPKDFSDCADWQAVVKRVLVNALGTGWTFFDPCAGRLLKFELALKIGAIAYAVELSPKLLADGLSRLSDLGHKITRL